MYFRKDCKRLVIQSIELLEVTEVNKSNQKLLLESVVKYKPSELKIKVNNRVTTVNKNMDL